MDGTWTLTHNTHPPPPAAVWMRAIEHLTQSSSTAISVSEDDPMEFTECTAVRRITHPRTLTMAFGYHETGGQPYTQLNSSEIDLYNSKCGGAQVAILTRAYWPSSPWSTRVQAVLTNPHLGGVAMEYNPNDYGKRSEQIFVKEILAAGKKAIFLWPLTPNNVSVETNVFDAISSFAQSCSNHTPPTAPCGPGYGCACGMDMASDNVWIVIARYGLPHGAACGGADNSECVFGRSNSMVAATNQALRLRNLLRSSTRLPGQGKV